MSTRFEGFPALQVLQRRLDASGHLEVLHEGGHVWRAHCAFQPPALPHDLALMREHFQVPFSTTYANFLLQYNGAVLFYDDVYGQWGFQIYGTDELVQKNRQWRALYTEWPLSVLVFGESYGDADLLLIDTAKQSKRTDDYLIMDGESGDLSRPITWKVIASSFAEWLDHLIVAQGAKYWRWS